MQLQNASQLITLAIVKGNDTTKYFARKLQHELGIIKKYGYAADISQVAKHIRDNYTTKGKLLALSLFEKVSVNLLILTIYLICQNNNSDIRKAIEFFYEFYKVGHYKKNLNLSKRREQPLTEYFRNGYRNPN